MKVALLLAVSEYNNPENNLPACKNDLVAMRDLLVATGQYEKIVTISEGNDSAVEVKNRISSWFDENHNEELDELFFLLYRTW